MAQKKDSKTTENFNKAGEKPQKRVCRIGAKYESKKVFEEAAKKPVKKITANKKKPKTKKAPKKSPEQDLQSAIRDFESIYGRIKPAYGIGGTGGCCVPRRRR